MGEKVQKKGMAKINQFLSSSFFASNSFFGQTTCNFDMNCVTFKVFKSEKQNRILSFGYIKLILAAHKNLQYRQCKQFLNRLLIAGSFLR